MAKPAQFKAYDLHRKKQHKIPSSPTKLSECKLREGEWKVSKRPKVRGSKKPVKKGRAKKTAAAVEKAPQRASDLLRCKGGEFQCLHCGAFSDDPVCGSQCYKQFRRAHLSHDLIDIRGPGPLGYGAFTKPGVTIPKGAWVGEYLGELRPLTADINSTYRFEIPGAGCAIDAQSAGNWTRFINSHCRPNVKPWGETVGKRHVVLFQAVREIGPGEEVVFDFGARYFENAGFLCGCDAHEKAHLPGGGVKKAKAKGRKK